MLFLETTSQNTSSGTGVWVKQTIGPFIPYVKIQGSPGLRFEADDCGTHSGLIVSLIQGIFTSYFLTHSQLRKLHRESLDLEFLKPCFELNEHLVSSSNTKETEL
jgi:hypothetical protein